MQIDPVEYRSGNPAPVFHYGAWRADARPHRVAQIAARARVHGTDEHEPCRVGEGDRGPRYCNAPVFERLAQKVENVSPELREFVEKEDPVVGEADLPGLGHVAAADKACVGYAVMRRTELALNDERVVVEHSCYAEYLGCLQRFVEAQRRKDPGEALGQHRFA